MAEVLKPISAVLSDTVADLYTCPPSTKALVTLQVANVAATAKTVTIQRTVAASSDAVRRLAYQTSVDVGALFSVCDFPIVLEAGDKIQGLCNTASAFEVNGSVLEVPA